MEYVSSDTNVWIDLDVIDSLELAFRSSLTYIMFRETIFQEMLYPENLNERLLSLGLQAVDITVEELFYADDVNNKYSRISVHDSIALAIAKKRNIILLTGDKALRIAAEKEGVLVMGTIELLDRLYNEHDINRSEYLNCILQLHKNNNGKVRLPEDELIRRLKDFGEFNK